LISHGIENAMNIGLFAESSRCLLLRDPQKKCTAVSELAARVKNEAVFFDEDTAIPPVDRPGRPDLPVLMEPAQVPRRRLGGAAGRIALVHAIAHIEFNAINLALDAVCRFRGMPESYYHDWISVANDEARHFGLLTNRLDQMDASYGDLPAHNGLWEMAEKTADSCLVRMALVPRVLEARGLDVTPGMIKRLENVGDVETISVLEVILEEEVRHVAIGTNWFQYCCKQVGKDPLPTFLELLEERYGGVLRGPFNLEARLAAGFTEEEMSCLDSRSKRHQSS
jgi:uncharacterized ferritin-like protein (DUF455 family)